MKRSTTGLSVRFFNVTITAGHDWTGKSTGNAFSEKRSPQMRRVEFGNVVIWEPEAAKLTRRCVESVCKILLGTPRPPLRRAYNSSYPIPSKPRVRRRVRRDHFCGGASSDCARLPRRPVVRGTELPHSDPPRTACHRGASPAGTFPNRWFVRVRLKILPQANRVVRCAGPHADRLSRTDQ